MRWFAGTRLLIAAGAAVTAAALLPGAFDAQAAPTARTLDRTQGHTRPLDNERDVSVRRGPFFELRVNSMDIEGDAQRIACLKYRCAPLFAGNPSHTYQLVRHVVKDGVIDVKRCDEILRPAFRGREVTYGAVVATTRWIRDNGPAGTPIGGFVGHARIIARVAGIGPDDDRTRIPLIRLGVIGTTGLRPGRGNTDEFPDALSDERCLFPRHDEGYYQGGFDKKGLRILRAALAEGDANYSRYLKVLQKSVIAGTFEGQLKVPASAEREYAYCRMSAATWQFDGLLGHRCRPRPVSDRPTDQLADGEVTRDEADGL